MCVRERGREGLDSSPFQSVCMCVRERGWILVPFKLKNIKSKV
jgi:hypothetical protein